MSCVNLQGCTVEQFYILSGKLRMRSIPDRYSKVFIRCIVSLTDIYLHRRLLFARPELEHNSCSSVEVSAVHPEAIGVAMNGMVVGIRAKSVACPSIDQNVITG